MTRKANRRLTSLPPSKKKNTESPRSPKSAASYPQGANDLLRACLEPPSLDERTQEPHRHRSSGIGIFKKEKGLIYLRVLSSLRSSSFLRFLVFLPVP